MFNCCGFVTFELFLIGWAITCSVSVSRGTASDYDICSGRKQHEVMVFLTFISWAIFVVAPLTGCATLSAGDFAF